MSANPRWRAIGLAAGAVVAVAAAVVTYADQHSVAGAAKALLAAVLAVAVAAFATTLPGVTFRGTVIGGLFVLAGFLTWTFTNQPLPIWAVLAVAGVILAFWSWPWLAHLRALPRLGTAWLGLAYWLLGIVGAVLTAHVNVAAQRVAYLGVFTLAALAVVATVRRPGGLGRVTGDPSVGMAAAIIVGLALLLLTGSGTLFDSIHAIPNHDASTVLMRHRFWGGPGLYFHPNSMAGLAIVMAIRIGPDRAFAAWQRLAATVLAGFVLYESNSRIGFYFSVAAAVVHGALLLLRRRNEVGEATSSGADRGARGVAGLPRYRRTWLAVLVPFAVLALVLALSGGRGFLFQSRFGGDDVSSGRLDTWKQVYHDWQGSGLPEKIFGNAQTSRAVVVRSGSDHKLNTDNAAVGAFRRGGVLGIIAFLIGLVLLLWHAVPAVVRRGPPGGTQAWFVVAAIAVVPTIATEDWLLGGTNGAIWLLLMAGEAVRLWYPAGSAGHATAEAAAVSGR